MGVRGLLGASALAIALLAQVAGAETQFEPILRLGLEGGHDSNVLFDGRGDDRARITPEVGLRLRDPLWTFAGVYGFDYLQFRRLKPGDVWNHHGELALVGTPTERTRVTGLLHADYVQDQLGLAQAGIIRTGESRALLLRGGTRVEYAFDRKLLLAGDVTERLVRFRDGAGGAMHAPSVELLQALSERFRLGGAFASSVFQDFTPARTTLAYSQALRLRARYQLTRFLVADGFAGPAFWSGPDGRALVPEAAVELRVTERDWDLRASVSHRLGLGSTAIPSLGDSVEFGTERRFGRKFDLRADGGLWHAGDVPTEKNATTWLAVSGEAGWYVTRELRLSAAAAHLVQLGRSSSELRRTTVGIRMGWELPHR